MKKLIALMLLGVFIASVAIGCGEKDENGENDKDKPAENDKDNGDD